MAGHTPGPWDTMNYFLIATSTTVIAQVRNFKDAYDYEAAANAKLMAAAPELLEALKAVVAVLQKEAPRTALNHHKYDALGIQAHAAIAKAEGTP